MGRRSTLRFRLKPLEREGPHCEIKYARPTLNCEL